MYGRKVYGVIVKGRANVEVALLLSKRVFDGVVRGIQGGNCAAKVGEG